MVSVSAVVSRIRVLFISVCEGMTLREAKALARSPQNTWVFNSSRELPLGISEDLQCLQPSMVDRVSGIKKNSDFSFNNLSGANVKDLGLHLKEDCFGSILLVNMSKNIGSSPVVSPSSGRFDFPEMKTTVLDEPLIPYVYLKNTMLDIF